MSPWFGHPYFHNAEKCLDVTNSKSQSRISDFATCTQFKDAVRQLVTTKYDVIYKTSPCIAQSSVLSVCDVGVLWPNGWMDQDETRHWGRPQDQPHCVRWGPSFPLPKGTHPQFSAHVCSRQTAGWIKMPLGTEVSLGPGDIVLDGDPSHPKRGDSSTFRPCLLWPNGWMDQDTNWYGGRPGPRPHCVRWKPSSPQRGTAPQFSAYIYCGQTVAISATAEHLLRYESRHTDTLIAILQPLLGLK